MAAKIQKDRPGVEVELVRGGRGDFIVTLADGGQKTVLWDKRAMGDEFPDEQEIVDELPVSR